jgi:glucose-6-phosphate 1-epimerase
MTAEELNMRYGAPGRIVFRKGFAGYPEVVLANKYGTAEIALLGANVLSYRPTGHSPVLFRPSKRDYNRGESIHGGLPVCWPQFGKLAIEGMSAHGFARVMPFEVRGTTYSEDMTEITLGLKSSADTKALWPFDFDLEFKVSVSMKLNLKLTTKNTGDAAFGFTAGFHPYFLVRERDNVSVRGLDGCQYVDARDMSTHVLSGDLAMNSEADHVFTLKSEPKHEFALMDPGLNRAIAMVSTGGGSAVVWNPGPAAKLADCEDGDWRKFVCVEPVTAWPKYGAMLAPGESHSLVAAIQSVAEER